MGAFEYTALDTGGREHNGVVEGDTVAARAPAAARAAAAAGHRRRGRAAGSQARSAGFSSAARRLRHRPVAADAPARHAGARPGLPLEEALLAVSQQTEKPRVQSIMLGVRAKVMEGHTLADGLCRVPARVPGDLPRHRIRGRAVRPPGRRARAPGRLHREPRGHAPEGAGRDALPDRAHRSCASASSRA